MNCLHFARHGWLLHGSFLVPVIQTHRIVLARMGGGFAIIPLLLIVGCVLILLALCSASADKK
jgi:hypothetical protein